MRAQTDEGDARRVGRLAAARRSDECGAPEVRPGSAADARARALQ